MVLLFGVGGNNIWRSIQIHSRSNASQISNGQPYYKMTLRNGNLLTNHALLGVRSAGSVSWLHQFLSHSIQTSSATSRYNTMHVL
eukprot:CCRYP_011163-RA/>CCRYP_011163-RA protein AED:0.22 eAED:0.22 QI:1567/1/1/1/1/1/2/268/84